MLCQFRGFRTICVQEGKIVVAVGIEQVALEETISYLRGELFVSRATPDQFQVMEYIGTEIELANELLKKSVG